MLSVWGLRDGVARLTSPLACYTISKQHGCAKDGVIEVQARRLTTNIFERMRQLGPAKKHLGSGPCAKRCMSQAPLSIHQGGLPSPFNQQERAKLDRVLQDG